VYVSLSMCRNFETVCRCLGASHAITPELIASPYTSSQPKQAPLRFVCNQSFEHEVLVALSTLSVNVTMALKCTVYIQNLGELDRKYRL
jgi:hypothetical protein